MDPRHRQSKKSVRWGSASAVVIGLLATTLAACGGDNGATTPSPTPTTNPTNTTSPASETVEIPATPVGEQMTWVLGALDPATPVTAEDAAGRLGELASEQLTGDQLVEVFAQLAATGPWRAISYDGTDTQALATIEPTSGDRLDLTLVLDADGLIETIFFAPSYEHVAAASWDDLREAVAALPADTTLVVTDVTDPAAPREVFATGEVERAQPIGSVFKLYVLGAVTEAVARGDLTWEDTLVVTDDLRSLPSGTLQDAPAGTEVSVREAAQAMIEISDNTATDLLINAVGREAVEAQLVAMGQADPGANTPLITTREMFWLGWGDAGAYRERWAEIARQPANDAESEAARRALLAELPAGPPDLLTTPEGTAAVTTEIVWPDAVDWFATPADLVAAHEALAELAATPAGEPLAEILGANPGLNPELASSFTSVAFKGGSSTGELALTWRIATPEAAWVVALQANSSADASAVADVRPYAGAAEDAIACAADLWEKAC